MVVSRKHYVTIVFIWDVVLLRILATHFAITLSALIVERVKKKVHIKLSTMNIVMIILSMILIGWIGHCGMNMMNV